MPSRYQLLHEKRAALESEGKEILDLVEQENRDPTDEERVRIKAVYAELDEVKEEIALRDKQREIERAYKPAGDDIASGILNGDGDQETQAGFTGEYAFGEFLSAVAKSYISGGREFDPRLQAAAAGMSSDIPSAGGFLVQKEMTREIWKRTYDVGELLKRIRKIRIGAGLNGIKINAIAETSRATGSRWGGVVGYWLAQGDAKVASAPEFRQIELELKKVAGLCYATDELLADAIALQGVIMTALPEELVFLVEDAIINGTGGGMPTGILNSGAVLSVAKETGQAAATLLYENVLKMWARMWGPSRKNAIWLVDQSIEPQLYSMSLPVGTGGAAVFMPAGGASAAPYATLFNRPIVPFEYGQALGTVGDIMLIDPTQFLLIEKAGIEAASSMHVRFTTDEMAFRFVYRVDGMPLWNSALTPKSGGDTLSPFITLAARA